MRRPAPLDVALVARVALVACAALAGCAAPAAGRPRAGAGEALAFQGPASVAPTGALETGRLSRERPSVAGPFVLTFLGAGDEVEVVLAEGRAPAIGTVVGPLATPLQVPAGARLVAKSPDTGALYSGYRPLVMTRSLEAYVGRTVQVAAGAAGQPEPWLLRQVGADHLILERSRSYRVVPLRRVSEISWTDLTGIDPTPRVTLAPE